MPVSFGAFFLMWAVRQKWVVPPLHWIMINWLETRGDLGVLRVFRGAGKSTILDIYFAWRIYQNSCYRILLQSESDGVALKSSRDTQNILRNHPLTRGLLEDTGTVESWWSIEGLVTDPRNPQFYAKGVLSNTTGSRADEAVNDDCEVPRNITTPELREKLRYRINEQTHILVPGAKQLFVGTPHAFDSIYDEQEQLGADCLTLPLFTDEFRIEDAKGHTTFNVNFHPQFVFSGIGKTAKILTPFVDYEVRGTVVKFAVPPKGIIDIYGASAWPERFDRAELVKRRKRTRTLNEWDSQYLLRSRPIHKVRLDPDRLREYEVEVEYKLANKELTAWLGSVQITGASTYWDVATGKKDSDASALTVMLQDARGQYYWHHIEDLDGDLAEFNKRGQINGGQVWRIREIVLQYKLSHVNVEVNGVGSFAGKLLKQALKGLHVGVTEVVVTSNKQNRILEGLEGPLLSNVLWAHTRVLDSDLYGQMRDFNPLLSNQEDGFMDSGAGAILEQPVKLGKAQKAADREVNRGWQRGSGTAEVQTEY